MDESFSDYEERALSQTDDSDAAKRTYAELRRIITDGRVTGHIEPWGYNKRNQGYDLFVGDAVYSPYRVVPAVFAGGNLDLRYNKWRRDADRQGQQPGNGRNVVRFQFRHRHMVLWLYVGRRNVPQGDAAADNPMLHGWRGGSGDPNFMVYHPIRFDVPISRDLVAGIEYAKQVANWAQLPE